MTAYFQNIIFLKLFIIIFSLIILTSGFSRQNNIHQSPDPLKIKELTEILGSDSLEGRGTGYSGGYKAAAILATHFEKYNLIKANGGSTYFQNIPFLEISVSENSVAEFISDNDTIKLENSQDYFVHRSGKGEIIPKHTECVFVGFGITAPEYDYNDYRKIDVLNKVAVMLSGEPASDDPEYFAGMQSTIHSHYDYKQRMAMANGAKACIIIKNTEEFNYEEWGGLFAEYFLPELALAYSPPEILTILIMPEIAEKLFENEQYNFTQLTHLFENNKLFNFTMKSKFLFKGIFKNRVFSAPNVVGLIEGSDNRLKNTCVVVTAHYDHLGIGLAVRGDSIFNGVLDNSLGAASLVEIARLMQLNPQKPKRSIVFLLTTAEEKGLLGSVHYLSHPVFPLYKTIANVNIDGVAFIDNFSSIIGIGSELSELGSILKKTALSMEMEIQQLPEEFLSVESFLRSDHFAFASSGIPSILVMDGTKYKKISRDLGISKIYNYFSNIYHTPFDDLHNEINYDAAAQHAEFLMKYIYDIADSETEPQWDKNSNYYYERIKVINEKR